MRIVTLLIAASLATAAPGCKKGEGSQATTAAGLTPAGLECDHSLTSKAIAKHSWPYPAELKDLKGGERSHKTRLKLKPNHASFVTATFTVKQGDHIIVEDSEVHIRKPRRLVAKRDLFVRRKVWDQGIEREKTYLAVAQGEVGAFLFYNSRGMCMVDTDEGPGWTPCSLDDAFEGLSEARPHACEQVWWAKVRRNRVEKGWMVVDGDLVVRVKGQDDEAK